MIATACRFVARSLLELALALVFGGLLCGYLAFRILRRFVVSSPDDLERLAGVLLAALALVAARNRDRT